MQTAYISHPSDYKTASTSSSSTAATAATSSSTTTTTTVVAATNATTKIIDYKRKTGQGPRFIFECAIKLNLKPLTSATAAIIFHRFFREVDTADYDEYVRDGFFQKKNLFQILHSILFSTE